MLKTHQLFKFGTPAYVFLHAVYQRQHNRKPSAPLHLRDDSGFVQKRIANPKLALQTAIHLLKENRKILYLRSSAPIGRRQLGAIERLLRVRVRMQVVLFEV